MGTRIHVNTSYQPLTTFLRRTMRYGQVALERQKVKRKVKNRHQGNNFTYTRTRPAEHTKTEFGIRGRVADVIICFKCYHNR